MKKSMFLRIGIAPLAMSIAMVSAPAMAQGINENEDVLTAQEDPTDDEAQAKGESAYVVTGSRIRRDEFSTVEPITVI